MMQGSFAENNISTESLMQSAISQTGLNDFGNKWFVPHLAALLNSLDEEAALNPQGRATMHERFVRFLATRLRLQRQLEKYPEILDESIEAPVIIIGLPRTGTTKLQRMMAASGDYTYLPLWQALDPVLDDTEEAGGEDNRAMVARDYVDMLRVNSPELMAVHEMDADEPEEEIMLMQHSFLTKVVYNEANIPSFVERVHNSDCSPVYSELSDWLKYIQWQNGGKRRRWLLKCVYHNEYLKELMEVFPDACLVQLHRDPKKVIGSWASLTEAFRKIYSDKFSAEELGNQMLQYWKSIVDRNLEILDNNREIVIKNFMFKDVVNDMDKVIESIYDFSGMILTGEACARMAQWEEFHPQHKHGRHDYALLEYGLNDDIIDGAFSNYCDTYNIK